MTEAARPTVVFGRGGAALTTATYTEMPVPAHLRHQVRALWCVRNPHAHEEQHRVFPDGYCDVVVAPDRRVLAAGPTSAMEGWPVHPGRCVLGARLRPGALPLLTAAAADEVTDRVVTLGILDTDGHSYDDHLGGLVRFLGPLQDSWSRDQERALRACAIVAAARRAPRASDLARHLSISERSLRSVFSRHVGLSLSSFHQVRRLQRTLALAARPEVSLSEIAARAGYSDQAHLCRQMRSLTGLTPAAAVDLVLAGSFKTADVGGRTMAP